MNKWYVLRMKRGEAAGVQDSIISDAIAMALNGVEPLPVYVEPDYLDEYETMYLPPESYALALKYKALPCEDQNRGRLSSLVAV